MPLAIKNLSWLRSLAPKEHPELGQKLGEALESIASAHNTIEQQGNFNSTGNPIPPPAINALHVSASNGHFQVSINHEGAEFYRAPKYFIEHADNPQFTNSHTVPMGTSRNANLFLGNATRYFRGYAAYDSSHPGPAVYHGSGADPKSVTGGGSIPGPDFSASQGSGTGTRGQGFQGPGSIPFRSKDGKPPVR